MPFVLIFLGILLLVVSIRGTQGDFFSLLQSEFAGSNSFVVWASAFIILGLLGYIRPIRPITHAFLVLLLLVLILTNGKGFVSQFNAAIRSPVAPSVNATSSSQTVAGGAAPVGSPLASSASQIQQGVPQVVDPNASGYEIQPIPGL